MYFFHFGQCSFFLLFPETVTTKSEFEQGKAASLLGFFASVFC